MSYDEDLKNELNEEFEDEYEDELDRANDWADTWIYPVSKITNDEQCMDVVNHLKFNLIFCDQQDVGDYVDSLKRDWEKEFTENKWHTVRRMVDDFANPWRIKVYHDDIQVTLNALKAYYEETMKQTDPHFLGFKRFQEIGDKFDGLVEASTKE